MKPIALIVGALAMAVLPGVAGDAGQWNRVRRLHAGTRIAIDLSDQRRVEGRLARASEADLTYNASRETTVSGPDTILAGVDRTGPPSCQASQRQLGDSTQVIPVLN